MASKTITKDLSKLGSLIKNYSTSTEGGFLSRIKSIVFYDVIDASLNEMYERLLNSVGKIEVTTIITGSNGEQVSLDEFMTGFELLKKRVDKLYTFHYAFNMGSEDRVNLMIGEQFLGRFVYDWGDFSMADNAYIKPVISWSQANDDASLAAGLAAVCASTGVADASVKVGDTHRTTYSLSTNKGVLTSNTNDSVTFTSALYTDPDVADLAPITSSLRVTWYTPTIFGTVDAVYSATNPGFYDNPTISQAKLEQWLRESSYKKTPGYRGVYNISCRGTKSDTESDTYNKVFVCFAVPESEIPGGDVLNIFNKIRIEGWSNPGWSKGGDVNININGIITKYVWFFNNNPQTDGTMEIELR